MKTKRFLYLLESYGAAIERWPEEEQSAARELLVTSAAARAARLEAQQLDLALDAGDVVIDPDTVARMRAGLRRRIAREPLPQKPRTFPLEFLLGLLQARRLQYIGFAVPVLVGLWLGWSGIVAPPPTFVVAMQGSPFVGTLR